MKRMYITLALAASLAFSCYKGTPPCDPTTVDWPRCDPTQPRRAAAPVLGSSLLYPRTATPVRIVADTLSAVTSYSKTWGAGQYSRIEFVLKITSASATQPIRMTLTGAAVNTYKLQALYQNPPGSAVTGYDQVSIAHWEIGGTYANSSHRAEIDITTGFTRHLFAKQVIPDIGGSVAQAQVLQGHCTDTANPITGINITFGTANTTGRIEVWGWP